MFGIKTFLTEAKTTDVICSDRFCATLTFLLLHCIFHCSFNDLFAQSKVRLDCVLAKRKLKH